MSQIQHLQAISPLDGRYWSSIAPLSDYFSEYALIKYRLEVEVLYFKALCDSKIPQLSGVTKGQVANLLQIIEEFDLNEAEKVKKLEKTTNHDIKALEYYLKGKLEALGCGAFKEFVHFALTSQDINNTAIPLSIKRALDQWYFPLLQELIEKLDDLARQWRDVPMLARTHGQPASPTRLGKEVFVFVQRLNLQLEQLKSVPIMAKFGGATGNFNAHKVAYPQVNWPMFADQFVEKELGLKRSQCTTQIEPYDHLAALFDGMRRINTILIDLARDIWAYISIDYFGQKIAKDEVGSSAMPHKVNPIDFENAEGNLGMSTAILGHLSEKLPISRWQRDLTDSTVLRNIGVPIGHCGVALKALLKGLNKLKLNQQVIEQDLESNWMVIAEGIQTILRREGVANPYEQLKALTRTNQKPTADSFRQFIKELDIANEIKDQLLALTPFNYLGYNYTQE